MLDYYAGICGQKVFVRCTNLRADAYIAKAVEITPNQPRIMKGSKLHKKTGSVLDALSAPFTSRASWFSSLYTDKSRATTSAIVSIYGDDSVDIAEDKMMMDKYGTVDLSTIYLHRFSLNYIVPPNNTILTKLNDNYLKLNSNPVNTFRSWILLFLVLLVLFIYDCSIAAKPDSVTKGSLVYVKFIIAFPVVFITGYFIKSKFYCERSQLLTIPVLIIALAMVADKLFVKLDVRYCSFMFH